MKATLIYKSHFNAAYQLQNPHWDQETNQKVFGEIEGKPAFQGHNYNLQVELTGDIDTQKGEVFSKSQLATLVKKNIENRFDHKNLYLDLDDFKDTVPTAEMMALRIWEILRSLIDNRYTLRVVVNEDNKNAAAFSGD